MNIHIDDTLELELTAEHHATEMFEAIDNNRDHLGVFLPWVPEMLSASDMTTYLKKCVDRYDQGVEFSFVMRWQGKLIGRIGLQYINLLDMNASIGYWLTKDAEGHGIITKCCRWLITYGFNTMLLHRIEIETAVENTRSMAIPKKLGFTQEGVLREVDYIGGRFLDVAVFSILKQEWT